MKSVAVAEAVVVKTKTPQEKHEEQTKEETEDMKEKQEEQY